jgi:hypothetical protein
MWGPEPNPIWVGGLTKVIQTSPLDPKRPHPYVINTSIVENVSWIEEPPAVRFPLLFPALDWGSSESAKC